MTGQAPKKKTPDAKAQIRRNLKMHLVDDELDAQLEDQPVRPLIRRKLKMNTVNDHFSDK